MNRIVSVDTFRVLAIISVISIHTSPFRECLDTSFCGYLDVLVNQGARFAVPFFFIISGYFFAEKAKHDRATIPAMISYTQKLIFIWMFFSAIYIFPYNLLSIFDHGILGPAKVVYWNLLRITENPVLFLFQGSQAHLWFLVSLSISILIASLFIHFFKPKNIIYLVLISLFLYIFGVLSKSYSETPIGIKFNFNTRNGPFFSTIFFVIGYVLSGYRITNRHLIYGLIIMLLGYVICFGEIYYLSSIYGIPAIEHDYVFGTLFIGLGASLMALSNHSILNIKILSKFGKYTLGIYGIHFVFVSLLSDIDKKTSNPAWEIGYIFLVFLLSTATTIKLSSYKKLNKFFV